MAKKKLITAADLDRMTPAERQQTFEESAVYDLSELPPAFLKRIQDGIERHARAREATERAS